MNRVKWQATAVALPTAVAVMMLWSYGRQTYAVALFLLAGPVFGFGLRCLNKWLDEPDR